MTRTRTKAEADYDVKEKTEVHLQTEVNKVIGDFIDRDSKAHMKVARDMHEIYILHQYNREKIRSMLRTGIATKLKLPWKKLTESKKYNSYNVTANRIATVACIEDKLFEEFYRQHIEKGRKFGSIWAEIDSWDKNKKKNLERLANREHDPTIYGGMKESLEIHAKRIEAKNEIEHVDSSYHKPKEDPNKKTSKSMFILDENTKWMQTCLSIARETPRLFMQMVDDYLGMLLSPETIAAIRKDLFKS